MNNYCTKCGKKLEKDELICSNCNKPIVDISHDHDESNNKKSTLNKEDTKKSVIKTGIVVICIIVGLILYYIIKRIYIQKKYVVPYLEKNYPNLNCTIKYESSGKCITDGDCYFDIAMGCDGGSCREYNYLDRTECKAYYYTIENDVKDFIITVVNRNGKYYAVEGRNIYGFDKNNDLDFSNNKNKDTDYIDNNESNNYNDNEDYTDNNESNNYNDDEDYIDNNETNNKNEEMDYTDNNKSSNKNDDKDIKDTVKKYPYESGYQPFNSEHINNQLLLDDNGMIMNYFTGTLSHNNNIYISGHIFNPKYYTGKVNMITKYYNKNHKEIGNCKETIELLGKGYSYISFSCHITEDDLSNNNSYKDIVYYKINISSLEIDE